LADFVERMVSEPEVRGARSKAAAARTNGTRPRTGRAIGVIGIPGDRRDEDQRHYGAIAAGAFDEIYVREDRNLRGRPPGETAVNVLAGVKDARANGARAVKAEKILDEMTAVRAALRRAAPGDLVVMCVDDAVGVYREAMSASQSAGSPSAFTDPGELEVPEG
ncbi:MAG: glutamate ligase domain-containing protein, partial [Candidatus Limnocylindrales bacterium]